MLLQDHKWSALRRSPKLLLRFGFTLVELIVVMSLVATLVAIAVPALSKSRMAARGILCLSNHRQFVAAWTSYTTDYRSFPYGSDSWYRGHERFGWGGVHWYNAGALVPGINIGSERPLNTYVAGDSVITARNLSFRCPLDRGGVLPATGIRPWEQLYLNSTSGEPNTCFGISGTSYECNVWMYCKAGATDGWGSGVNAMKNYRSRQEFKDVSVSPSALVVLKDVGPANWMVTSPSLRVVNDLWGDWWHGPERNAMSFLDGSARVEPAGLLVSSRYSMHLSRFPGANGTWRWPYQP